MEVRVLGCHGGPSTAGHRNTSFLIDGRLAVDAGSLATGLDLEQQGRIEVVVVSHAHMDHVADLGFLVDLRAQAGGAPLVIAADASTVGALRRHYFNDVLWPDFTVIPTADRATLRFLELAPEEPVELCGRTVVPVPVDHTIPSCGFLIGGDDGWLAYSGDTGPTKRFWELVSAREGLAAVITEVSFPDAEVELAKLSGHMTPTMLRGELDKLSPKDDVPVYLYGMKPLYEAELARELAPLAPRVRSLTLGEVLKVNGRVEERRG